MKKAVFKSGDEVYYVYQEHTPHEVPCWFCKGTGSIQWGKGKCRCPKCIGSGFEQNEVVTTTKVSGRVKVELVHRDHEGQIRYQLGKDRKNLIKEETCFATLEDAVRAALPIQVYEQKRKRKRTYNNE